VQDRMGFFSEAYLVVRKVSLYLILIGVLACAMVSVGWRSASVAIGAALAVVAGMTVNQVRTALLDLHRESRSARQAAAEAEKHYVEILRRVVRFVEARDSYLRGHSENVGRFAGQIAERMGWSPDECARLALAGELHDIGLLAVPEHVLEHVRFGVEDLDTVRKHSEASCELLKPLVMLADVLPAIRHHHERLNGTGYPAGLAGEAIPLGARILAAADAYDAITHDRPHRPALSPLAAMRELERCTPAGFDPDCIAALGDILHAPALQRTLARGPAGTVPAPPCLCLSSGGLVSGRPGARRSPAVLPPTGA